MTSGGAKQDLVLLLVGWTGNGKSSIGNAILRSGGDEAHGASKSKGRKKEFAPFKIAHSLNPATLKCEKGTCEQDGRQIKVINTPDLANPRKTDAEAKKEVEKWLEKADNRKPDAVCLVIRCDRRYTREEFNVYQQLKDLLGDKLSDNLVIIFSMGDRLKCKDLRVDLNVTCDDLKTVLEEADHRYMVFDDTATETDQAMQVAMLLEVVETKLPHPFPQQMCRLLVFGDSEGMKAMVSAVCGTAPADIGKSVHLTTSRPAKHDGLNIEVATAPDFICTGFAAREDQHCVKRAAEIAISPGPHAVIFVLKDLQTVEKKQHFPFEHVKKMLEVGATVSKFLMLVVYNSGNDPTTDAEVVKRVRNISALSPLLLEMTSDVVVLHDSKEDDKILTDRVKKLVSRNKGEFFMSLKIREEWKTVRDRMDKQPPDSTVDGRYKSYVGVKQEYMDHVTKSIGGMRIIQQTSPANPSQPDIRKSSYCPIL